MLSSCSETSHLLGQCVDRLAPRNAFERRVEELIAAFQQGAGAALNDLAPANFAIVSCVWEVYQRCLFPCVIAL
jgi:hypothetical protein